jgi:hypothetical protein
VWRPHYPPRSALRRRSATCCVASSQQHQPGSAATAAASHPGARSGPEPATLVLIDLLVPAAQPAARAPRAVLAAWFWPFDRTRLFLLWRRRRLTAHGGSRLTGGRRPQRFLICCAMATPRGAARPARILPGSSSGGGGGGGGGRKRQQPQRFSAERFVGSYARQPSGPSKRRRRKQPQSVEMPTVGAQVQVYYPRSRGGLGWELGRVSSVFPRRGTFRVSYPPPPAHRATDDGPAVVAADSADDRAISRDGDADDGGACGAAVGVASSSGWTEEAEHIPTAQHGVIWRRARGRPGAHRSLRCRSRRAAVQASSSSAMAAPRGAARPACTGGSSSSGGGGSGSGRKRQQPQRFGVERFLGSYARQPSGPSKRRRRQPPPPPSVEMPTVGGQVRTSAYRGVSWLKKTGQWRAQIRHQGRDQYLGCFADEGDAAWAYDARARQLHGAAARLNFPGEGERQGTARARQGTARERVDPPSRPSAAHTLLSAAGRNANPKRPLRRSRRAAAVPEVAVSDVVAAAAGDEVDAAGGAVQSSVARAMELSVVRELFSIFDADGDGRLSKEEFALYLRGIKLWGTEGWGQHEGFTDDDWAERWPTECQKFECTTGEITVALLN